MLSFGSAEGRDVRSLQNWLDGTGCLAREETAYLTHSRDLVSLAPAGDNAVLQVETWVEDKLIRFYRGFRKVRESQPLSPQANRANSAAFTTNRPIQTCISIPDP
jgi:hypothetical protein